MFFAMIRLWPQNKKHVDFGQLHCDVYILTDGVSGVRFAQLFFGMIYY
jgi:hypothetical protein